MAGKISLNSFVLLVVPSFRSLFLRMHGQDFVRANYWLIILLSVCVFLEEKQKKTQEF